MDPIINTVRGYLYEIKVYESFSDLAHGAGENIEEIFVPSHELILNYHGNFFKSEKTRNKSKFSVNIQLPLDLVEKMDHIAKEKLALAKKEAELTPDIKLFVENINVVQFQKIGYIQSDTLINCKEGAIIVNNPDEWNSIATTCGLTSSIPKIDFATQKIIAITKKINYKQGWLIVHRIKKDSFGTLKIECGPLHSTYLNPSKILPAIQFIAIAKDINCLKAIIVPLKIDTIAEFDPQLAKLEVELLKCNKEQRALSDEIVKEHGEEFFDKYMIEKDSIESITDLNQKELVTKILGKISEINEIEELWDNHLKEISDYIRGPLLL